MEVLNLLKFFLKIIETMLLIGSVEHTADATIKRALEG